MEQMKRIILLATLAIMPLAMSAQTATDVIREDIEWLDIWGPNNNDHALPRVLLIGDSITRQYNAGVEKNLEGKAYVERLATSKSLGDPSFLDEVRLILTQYDFDIVHVNNGLHGSGYTSEQFAADVPKLYSAIRSGAPHARIIWATNTVIWVKPEMKEFAPQTQMGIERNDIVLKFMADKDVVIDDLFKEVGCHPEYYVGGDGAHLNPTGIDAAAKVVADCICDVLDMGPRTEGISVYWDTDKLGIAPKATPMPKLDRDGVTAALLEGIDYRGDKTKFFAYYSLPEGADAEHPVPGVVLIHGGEGSAYANWVKEWNKRGYAAISMALNGQFPVGIEGNPYDLSWGNWAFIPDGIKIDCGDFEHSFRPVEEQWCYCAVADIMLAHSFLRSLPGVDPERIGVTGNSWGGHLTLLSAAIDKRYKFAAPVYGCAYFGEFDANAGRSDKVWERWLELWDPSHYLSSIDVPLLWTAGATEGFFSFKQYQKTLAQFPDSYCALRAPMIHVDGAFEDGRPVEIYELADHLFKGEADLPKVAMPYMGKNGKAVVEYDTAGRTVGKIELIYSTEAEGTVLWKDRNWQKAEIPQPKKGSTVSFKLPEGTTMFFVNLITEGGVIGTSRCLFL